MLRPYSDKAALRASFVDDVKRCLRGAAETTEAGRALIAQTCCRAKAGLVTSAWIVVGIDVVELQGRLTVDLNDGFSASHGEMVHVGIEKGETAGNERFHFASVELIAHADFECAGNDRDVFP